MPLPTIEGILLAIKFLWLMECDEMRLPEVFWDNYINLNSE